MSKIASVAFFAATMVHHHSLTCPVQEIGPYQGQIGSHSGERFRISFAEPWTYKEDLSDRVQDVSENRTQQENFNENLFTQAKEIFATGKNEEFEDGVESNFSRMLQQFLRRNKPGALEAVQQVILSPDANPEVVAESLRWLGRIIQPATHMERMWLLTRCLGSASARIRDGAILGLGSLDEPKSLPYLQIAINSEADNELREDMLQLKHQLEETARWRSSFAK